MSVRVPGADTVEQFWENVRNGRSAYRQYGNQDGLNSTESDSGTGMVNGGYVLERPAHFDPKLFRMSPAEAEITDPQHRLFLTTCYRAVESAGYDPFLLRRVTGLFAGCSDSSHGWRLLSSPEIRSDRLQYLRVASGNSKDYLATLASYRFGWTGPSMTIGTACSSSLVALHLAGQAIVQGECDQAVAGGVMVDLEPPGYEFHEQDMRSADGRCLPFIVGSTGTAFSNGASAVLLKRWDLALQDGDRILGEIVGSAVNNDGSDKIGMTAPSVLGQSRVIAEALAMAEIEPGRVGMFEAHGTGTPLGDPVEVQAAATALGTTDGRCRLHSVKANIGHLSHAAGVAGLVLAIEALRSEEIPPNAPLCHGHNGIALDGSPFYLSAEAISWPRGAERRYACVSSLGIGGTNAHVVVGDAPAPRPVAAGGGVLLVSGVDKRGLAAATVQIGDHLRDLDDSEFADLCRTSQLGRHHGRHRLAVAAPDPRAAMAGLSELDARGARAVNDPRIAFVIGGQGRGFPRRAADLYRRYPVFAKTVDELARIVEKTLGTDPRGRLLAWEPEHGEPLELQPTLFILAAAVADLLRSWGITADAYLGHSVGEFIGACLAGLLAPADAVQALCERATLMAEAPQGQMWSVAATPAAVRDRLPEGAVVALVNAERRCVVSAPTDGFDGLPELLGEISGRPVRRLQTRYAFHHPALGDAAARFAEHLSTLPLAAPTITVTSNVTGELLTTRQAVDPAYWALQMTAPVHFWDCARSLTARGVDACVEVTEGQTFSKILAGAGLPGRSCHPLFVDDEPDSIGNVVGGLWTAGVPVRWDEVAEHTPFLRTRFPGQVLDERAFLHPIIRAHRPDIVEPPATETPVAAAAASSDDGIDELRTIVAEIWAEVLGAPPEDGGSDFFDQGGDSISAGQVITRLRGTFGIDLAVRRLFDNSTWSGLVSAVDEQLLALAIAESEAAR